MIKYKFAFQKRAIAKGIENAYALSRLLGGSLSTGGKWWSGEAEMIQLQTMSRLCAILDVTPGKLFVPADEEEPDLAKVKGKIEEIAPVTDYPQYVIWIQPLAKARGIPHAYALYEKMRERYNEGSKSTAALLWHGNSKMISLAVISRLCEMLNCGPGRLFATKEEVKAQGGTLKITVDEW